MNNNNYANILDIKETMILTNLKKILRIKQITISEVVLINYIRNNHISGFISVEIINNIIKECMIIENNNNKIEDNEYESKHETIEVIEDSNINNNTIETKEAPKTIAETIISNMNSTVPKRELREELIYVKGISGVLFTNTFKLNKTFNNVESIELMNGYVNDDRISSETNNWEVNGLSDASVSGIIKDTNISGSIGPIPFLWLDIVEPKIRTYAHYSNYSVSEIIGNCSDCSGSSSYCAKCGRSGETFIDCNPAGSFLVSLKQINSVKKDTNGLVLPQNMVYIVDHGVYKKKFNQLITMNKLKINLKNINGRMLWGCDACSLGNSGVKTSNILRWEFIFKVKYYVNVLENNFLLQN